MHVSLQMRREQYACVMTTVCDVNRMDIVRVYTLDYNTQCIGCDLR